MSTPSDDFKKGLKAYEAGAYEEAEQAFLNILKTYPTMAQAQLNLGNVYFKQEQIEKAESVWLKLIQLDPLCDRAYLNLGNMYYQQGNFLKAIYYWEVFRHWDADHEDVLINLGLAYEKTGQLHEAFAVYRYFLKKTNSNRVKSQLQQRLMTAEKLAEHNSQVAVKSMRLGQLRAAATAFEQSVYIAPLAGKIYQYYATVLYKLEQFDDAVFWYEQALAHEPHQPNVLTNLGILYERLNQPMMALWAYQEVAEASQGDASEMGKRVEALWTHHGVAALDQAIQRLKQALSDRDYFQLSEKAQRLLRLAEKRASNNVKDLQVLIKAIEQQENPKRSVAEAAFTEGEAFYGKGQYEKALIQYQRYLQLQPKGDKVETIRDKLRQIETVIDAILGVSEVSEPSSTSVA